MIKERATGITVRAFHTSEYSEEYSSGPSGFDDPLLPSDDDVSPSCCDGVTYQGIGLRQRKIAVLTCTRSSRRISVAFLTCTIMVVVSRPPTRSRVLHDSMSRLLSWPPDGSEPESMMDPFTGASVEDGGEPLSPARTMISVGANA